MNAPTFLRQVSAAAALLCAAVGAMAGPLLYVSDQSSQLGTVDVTTGTVVRIGNMGVFMTDIAFSPTGDLFGIDFVNLYRINKVTAAVTFIGAHGMTSSPNSLVFSAAGILYSAGSSLYTVNTATGMSTVVGSIGYQSAGDLAFVDSQLYLAAATNTGDSLVKINTTTGAGTLVGNIGFGDVYGLASPNNTTLYGLNNNQVLSISTTTGAGQVVATYNPSGVLNGAAGSAFFAEAGAPLPEPATYGLVAVALAGCALARRNRKV